MLGNLARRAVNVVVLALAGYAFFTVHIGRRTPFRHLVAIFSTEPAREAATDFRAAGSELKDRVVEESRRLGEHPRDGG